MKASEANALALSEESKTKDLNSILERIKIAASEGKLQFMIGEKTAERLWDRLSDLGYAIVRIGKFCYIDWSSPE